MPHKTQFLGSWRAAVESSPAGTSDPKQVYKGVPTPLPAQKGRKSHAEMWGRMFVATSIPVSEENA